MENVITEANKMISKNVTKFGRFFSLGLLFFGWAVIVSTFVVNWFFINYCGHSLFLWKYFIAGLILGILSILTYFKGLNEIVPVELPQSKSELRKGILVFIEEIKKNIIKKKTDVAIIVVLFFLSVVGVSLYQSSLAKYDLYITHGRQYLSVPIVQVIIFVWNLIKPALPLVSPFGILYGIEIIALYGIFRLGMGKVVSLLCLLSIMFSAIQMNHLMPFFDKYFIRTPFVFALIFIMGLLVTRVYKPKKIIGMSILAGLIMGVGIMFRPDLLVFGFNMILAIVLFAPKSSYANTKVKAFAILVFVLVTFFTFLTYPKGNLERKTNSHAFVNGSSTFFDERFGLKNPGYDWNYLFLDEFTSSISFAQARVQDQNLEYRDYGPVDNQRKLILSNFPADILMRFYATLLKIVEIPFEYILPPFGLNSSWISSLFKIRGMILGCLQGFGLWFLVVSLLMISGKNLRKGFFCLLLLSSLILLPFVHWLGYYFFYLEFISYWAIGFIIFQTYTFTKKHLHGNPFHKDENLFVKSHWAYRIILRRLIIFILTTSLIVTLPLYLLRFYQRSRIANIVDKYRNADIEPLQVKTVGLKNGGVLLTDSKLFYHLTNKGFKTEELMLELYGNRAGCECVWLTLRYDGAPNIRMNFSRSVSINQGGGGENIRYYFPVMSQKDMIIPPDVSYFSGIEISANQRACIKGLYRVKDLRELPMLLTLQLPLVVDLETYRSLERHGKDYFETVPANLSTSEISQIMSEPLSPITKEDVEYIDPIVHLGDINDSGKDALIIEGYAEDNTKLNPLFPIEGPPWKIAKISYVNRDALLVDTDLLITKPKWHKKGSVFVAKGRLFTGGVLFALINENKPSGTLIVDNPGPFSIAMKVPADGMYSVNFANYLAYYNTLENRLEANVGWIEQ